MNLLKLNRESIIVLKYLAFWALWIIFSDPLITYLSHPLGPLVQHHLQASKDWLFVGITVALLYMVLKRDFGRIRASEHSLAELHSIVNASPMVVCRWEYAPGAPVQAISENAKEVFGYPVEQFLSGKLKYADIVHPEDLPRINDEVLGFIRSDKAKIPQRYRIVAQDGAIKWMEDQTILRRNAKGRISHFEGIVFDVTEKKMAEEKLQHQHELLQTIMDNIPLMVVFMATDGALQWVNRAWENAIGWKFEEALSRNLMQEMYPDPQLRQKVVDFIRNAHGIWEVFNTRNKTGDLLEITWSNVALSNGTKIVFGQDLSDIRKGEKQRRELEEQLRHSQKLEAVGRLAGGVAHDFNNLLSVIIGYTEILKRKLHPLDHGDYPNQIMEAAERAKNLTRQLLAFGRRQMLDIKVLDVNEVVRSFEKLLHRVIGEDICMALNLAPQTCHVQADISQLEQILMNLVVNARDAMPDGGTLTIETARVHLDEAYIVGKPDLLPGDYVMISISDTGRGMDREVLQYIFEPFFTTKDQESGSGLGLSTVYGIVKQHNGHIWVYSEPNQGTLFKIYLPREAALPDAVSISRKPLTPNKQTFSTSTILIVEDNEAVRDVLCTLLTGQGFQVLAAASGHQAIEEARNYKGPLDLLLTDVVMPGMKGPEVYQNLVQHQPGIQVLYMSGYTENIIFREGVLQEGIHFIQKPFPLQVLIEKLDSILAAD
jgi:two-component system, cell cycle sensor histidine kinase and response regulator CckA